MTEPVVLTCCGPQEPVDLRAWWRIGLGAVIAANALTLSVAIDSSAATDGERRGVYIALALLATASAALLGGPLLRNTLRALARRQVTLEAMFLAGIVGATVASAVAALHGEGDVYFEIVSILLVVYAIGQQVSAAAQQRALTSVAEWAPALTTCTVLDADGERTVPVSELEPGMLVRVAPGAMIPADGVVEAGACFVREAEMTGEPAPAVRGPGDGVWAGTCCLDGALTVRASARAGERRIDGIVAAVEAARAAPATVQLQADRVVGVFLPVLLAVAGLTFAGWALSAGWQRALFNAMAVLLVACPCALGLATPLAVWAAMARLATRGLLVRGGEVVEALAGATTVVLDKTGTLTTPEAVLLDLVVEPRDDLDDGAVRELLATVERAVDHPVAAAFHDLAPAPSRRFAVEEIEVLAGAGVRAAVRDRRSGRRLRTEVGDGERLGLVGWDDLARRPRAGAGSRRVALGVDGHCLAVARVDERLRPTWPEALAALRRLGVSTVVMSGDRTARALAVGADRALGDLAPDDKLREVRRLQAAGERVLFVGDGVNDAAAMAAAEAGLAVGTGTDLAVEVAGGTWHGGDLRALPWALESARAALAVIRSNLWFSVLYNVIGVGLAAAGLLHPVAAAVLMMCSSLVVTWRASSLLREDEQAAGTGPGGEVSWTSERATAS